MIDKDELRFRMRLQREKVSALQLMEISARIGERVLAMKQYRDAQRVMCYYGLPSEVQTAGLIREMIRSGRQIYLPVMGRGRSLRAVRLERIEALHRAAFGVMEPSAGEEIAPEELDLILTPGLAFDKAGGRIGYGRGYYDRFLPRCRGTIAGLAASWQLVECVPMENRDVYMHFVVTEDEVYRCGRV